MAGIQAVLGLAVAALLLASLTLVIAGPGARAEGLSASLVDAPRGADVVAVSAPKKVVALRAEPTRPIDVPGNPYAPETIVELGRLAIPKLGVDQKMMQGITLNNIDQGPSHWPGTAYPGQQGNSVIAGHRVTHSKPFRNLDRLVPGDEVIVSARGVRATYAVKETFIVSPSQTQIVDPTTSPVLTLFACHPPGSAKQRIVVRADLVGVQSV